MNHRVGLGHLAVVLRMRKGDALSPAAERERN